MCLTPTRGLYRLKLQVWNVARLAKVQELGRSQETHKSKFLQLEGRYARLALGILVEHQPPQGGDADRVLATHDLQGVELGAQASMQCKKTRISAVAMEEG